MKRLLLIIFVLAPFGIQAQNVALRFDSGLGGAFSSGKFKSYGLAVFTEPKVLIGPRISMGLRLEGDILLGGSISREQTKVDVGMSARSSILVKGEYYFGSSKIRTFAGLGIGEYFIANTAASSRGASITAGNHFGVAPELGITLGNFRISWMYHLLTGEEFVTLSAGSTEQISLNYFVVQLGFRVFGIGDK